MYNVYILLNIETCFKKNKNKIGIRQSTILYNNKVHDIYLPKSCCVISQETMKQFCNFYFMPSEK